MIKTTARRELTSIVILSPSSPRPRRSSPQSTPPHLLTPIAIPSLPLSVPIYIDKTIEGRRWGIVQDGRAGTRVRKYCGEQDGEHVVKRFHLLTGSKGFVFGGVWRSSTFTVTISAIVEGALTVARPTDPIVPFFQELLWLWLRLLVLGLVVMVYGF